MSSSLIHMMNENKKWVALTNLKSEYVSERLKLASYRSTPPHPNRLFEKVRQKNIVDSEARLESIRNNIKAMEKELGINQPTQSYWRWICDKLSCKRVKKENTEGKKKRSKGRRSYRR